MDGYILYQSKYVNDILNKFIINYKKKIFF